MKALIVDDEKMIRKGISKILSDSFPDIAILEAHNGECALDLFHSEHPDILITDIKMPVMDGIELMKNVRAEDKSISIVVVTGFDDFNYARSALKAGASAYILKPIEKSELIETATQLISERQLTSKGRIERILSRGYVDGGFSREALSELSFLIPYRVAAVLNPRYQQRDTDSDSYHLSLFNKGFLVIEKGDAKDHEPDTPNGYIGYSEVKTSFDDLQTASVEAQAALFCRFIGTEGKVFHSEGLGSIGKDIPDKINKINSQLGIASSADIEKSVKELFEFPSKIDRTFYLYSVSEALKNGVFSKFSSDEDKALLSNLSSLSTIATIEAWSESLATALTTLNERIKNELPDNSFITKALRYIDKNYSKNINMAVVSNEVGISYTYFSEKFKEHTNTNFNDYLTAYRVKKAKELLSKGCYRIYEVSERCGFSGPRYFIKIFKKETGITPTAYMNQSYDEMME